MNLLRNPQFRPGPDGCLLYYRMTGPVRWDVKVVNNSHCCSLTQPSGSPTSTLAYAVPIWIKDHQTLSMDCFMQASGDGRIDLTVRYEDENGYLVGRNRKVFPMAPSWTPVRAAFAIPEGAAKAWLALEFVDEVTKCWLRQPNVEVNW